MKPAVFKHFSGCFVIVKITFHHCITTHYYFTNRFSICRDRIFGLRINHTHRFHHRESNSLPCQEFSLTGLVFIQPFFLKCRLLNVSISFSQTINVHDFKSEFFHTFKNLCRRRSTGSDNLDGTIKTLLFPFWGIGQHVQHNRCTTKMCYLMTFQQFKQKLWAE